MKTCSNCDNSEYEPEDSLDIQEVFEHERCEKCNFYSEWGPRLLILNFRGSSLSQKTLRHTTEVDENGN